VIVRRLGAIGIAAIVAAAVVVPSARAALFFLFKPTTANAGEVVTVRLGGTPPGFTLEQREKPLRRPLRLYLVPSAVAGEVSSRFDRRLHFVGALYPDKNSRGILSFVVPPLDTGPYAIAYWCRTCAPGGRAVFGVQTVPQVSRFRHLMGLRLRMPPATETCPVSGDGPYGNGLLSTLLPPDGIRLARKDPDGTLFDKLGWLPHRPFPNTLEVRGERLDAPSPPLRVISVNWGYSIVNGRRQRGSWASAVVFPSEGCWRITGRVQDVALSYVVKVVAER
jgi:hypothetical protein